MPRKPIGEVAMSVAERSRRRRAKVKAQAEANGSLSMGIPMDRDSNQAAVASNGAVATAALLQRHAPQLPAAVDLLAGGPEAIAARIFERVPVEMARGIAMALQQRLLQGGCWPTWRLPML